MRVKLLAIGHKPIQQGGNGKGPTVPQKMLALALGWEMEFAVSLGERRRGYPTHYKLDIANAVLKIGIEVDGSSHNGRRRGLDQKKEVALSGLGWIVLRFTNKQVMEHLEECVQTVLSTTSKLKGHTLTSQME